MCTATEVQSYPMQPARKGRGSKSSLRHDQPPGNRGSPERDEVRTFAVSGATSPQIEFRRIRTNPRHRPAGYEEPRSELVLAHRLGPPRYPPPKPSAMARPTARTLSPMSRIGLPSGNAGPTKASRKTTIPTMTRAVKNCFTTRDYRSWSSVRESKTLGHMLSLTGFHTERITWMTRH